MRRGLEVAGSRVRLSGAIQYPVRSGSGAAEFYQLPTFIPSAIPPPAFARARAGSFAASPLFAPLRTPSRRECAGSAGECAAPETALPWPSTQPQLISIYASEKPNGEAQRKFRSL